MKIFNIKNTSPYETLTLENIIMNDKDITEDVLLIYQHDNSIIIGQNQNMYEEINLDFVKEHNITLARRKSGGGAVYHDLGNLNFSFITDKSDDNSYQRFLTPIIAFLNSLGIQAEFHGRNDILANGCKISGNAQYIQGHRIVSHGTLLFNVDMTYLAKALNPNKIKYESKGIKSHRARVANIVDILPEKMTVEEFKQKLIEYFTQNSFGHLDEIPMDKYQQKFDELSNKFKSDEWIFDKFADFNYTNTEKFAGGLITVKGQIVDGYIKNIKFEGDFLSKKELNDVESAFSGIHYDDDSIMSVLNNINLEEYFGTIAKEELFSLIRG
ncbi:lipoate--protein ligase [Mycoplasmopsis felifaucium]|uniref:lipoate--protein ligase n=1 Tax=Mycoplasmopsis felifaucium TaxID=35768 RepID=A0ABZ2RPS8_9BACT